MQSLKYILICLLGVLIGFSITYFNTGSNSEIEYNSDSIIAPYIDSINKLDTIIDSLEIASRNVDSVRVINKIKYVKIKEELYTYTDDYLDSIIFMEPGQYEMLLKSPARSNSR